MTEQLQSILFYVAGNAYQVFLVQITVLSNQLFGNSSVLSKYQKTNRVDVQTTCRSQPKLMLLAVPDAAFIFRPMVGMNNQRCRSFITFFRLRTDIAHRFMQQYGHPVALLLLRLRA